MSKDIDVERGFWTAVLFIIWGLIMFGICFAMVMWEIMKKINYIWVIVLLILLGAIGWSVGYMGAAISI